MHNEDNKMNIDKHALPEGADPEKGFVINCLINPREEDCPLFHDPNNDGTLVAKLDGYAIIPIEEYEELVAKTQ